jgi:hypothetical protein
MLLLVPVVVVRWHVQAQEAKRQASLRQFPFRLVLPPEVAGGAAAAMAAQVDGWIRHKDGRYQDGAGRVVLLGHDEVARLIPLQESWISEGLGALPVPPRLPWIIEVYSVRAALDPILARDLTEDLRALHQNGLVVHEQLALDGLLSQQRSERLGESRLVLAVNGAAAFGMVWAGLAGWWLRRRESGAQR